jgi:hypothetical protein
MGARLFFVLVLLLVVLVVGWATPKIYLVETSSGEHAHAHYGAGKIQQHPNFKCNFSFL